MNRAVFLDRDGTLIEERHYLKDPGQVVLIAGAANALRRLSEAGFLVIMVTNQSGIGRGYFTEADMHGVHAHIDTLLAGDGARVDATYFAPEAPDQPSRGRKPSPQFLHDARDRFQLDLAACYMIGDKRIDLECGWNAGVRRCLLVRTGYGAELERKGGTGLAQAVVVDDLAAAAEWILQDVGC